MERRMVELSVKRLIKFDGGGSLRAYCDLVIGEQFLIKGVRVVEGKNGLFVSMPRQQGKDTKWYDSVVALTKDTKEEVGRVVLDAYEREVEHGDSPL
jgi:stage V sporulation protein G